MNPNRRKLKEKDFSQIRKNIKYAAENEETIMQCPYCERWTISTYPDTKGHIKRRCDKCREDVVFFIAYRYSNNSWSYVRI